MPFSVDRVIEELNRLLAEEVEASLRYLHLMSSLDQENEMVTKLLQETFEETVEHAQILGVKIRGLGGMPRMQIRLDCPPKAVTAQEAISDALTVEEAALEGYQELFDRLKEEGGDHTILSFLETQVELESEHVEELRRLLKENE